MDKMVKGDCLAGDGMANWMNGGQMGKEMVEWKKRRPKQDWGKDWAKKEEGGFPVKAKAMTGWDMAGNRGMMAGQSAIDQPPSFEEMASLAPMSQPAGYSFGWKPALG